MLPDAGRIQEEDARQANKHGYTKHDPALPLYTESDALRGAHPTSAARLSSGQSKSCPASRSNFIRRDICLVRHSSWRDSRVARAILFGGDLGRYGRPVLPDPLMRCRLTSCWSNPPMAIAITQPDDNGEQLRRGHRDDSRARRQADHPGIRDRPRRGAAVLDAASRAAEHRIPGAARSTLTVRWPTDALKFYSARVAELDPDMRPTAEAGLRRSPPTRFQTVSSPQQSKELTASRRSRRS